MKRYILSIVISGIVCGITGTMLNKNTTTGKLVKILTGVLMCVTILTPLTQISFEHITDYFDTLSIDAEYYTQNGKSAAQTDIHAIIKSQTEAYILDKAESLELKVAVEVELDENDSVPCGVIITGAISPYAKRIMEAYLEETIGISKENQQWI